MKKKNHKIYKYNFVNIGCLPVIKIMKVAILISHKSQKKPLFSSTDKNLKFRLLGSNVVPKLSCSINFLLIMKMSMYVNLVLTHVFIKNSTLTLNTAPWVISKELFNYEIVYLKNIMEYNHMHENCFPKTYDLCMWRYKNEVWF